MQHAHNVGQPQPTENSPTRDVTRRLRRVQLLLWVLVGCALGAGLLGCDLLGSKELTDASIANVEHVLADKTVWVGLRVEPPTLEKVYITLQVRQAGKTETLHVRPLHSNPHAVSDGGVGEMFEVEDISAGEYELTVYVSGEGVEDGKILKTKLKVAGGLEAKAGVLSCVGRECHVSLIQDTLRVAAGEPATVKIGDRSVKLSPGKTQELPFALEPALFATDPADILNQSMAIPISFAFADGSKLAGTFELSGDALRKRIIERLRSGASKGVSFPGDDAAPPKPRRVAIVRGDKWDLLGEGASFATIDRVAVVDGLAPRESSCGSYTQVSTGKRIQVKRHAFDTVVTVHGRRTGRQLARRVFRAPLPECPTNTAKDALISSDADEALVEAYLKSLL